MKLNLENCQPYYEFKIQETSFVNFYKSQSKAKQTPTFT